MALLRPCNLRVAAPPMHALPRRRGAMMVLVAALLVVFMVAVGMSIDIAHMHLARTELRSATDAASKAAALELSLSGDLNRAIARGSSVAAENRVVGSPLLLAADDFAFGHSLRDPQSGRFEFRRSAIPLNSVRVEGRPSGDTVSGRVPLFFGHLMGVPYFEPEAVATSTFLNRDVVLVVDRSGSMAGQLMDELRQAIGTFTRTLRETPVDEHVGLASYAEFATADVPLSPRLAAIDAAAAALNANGWTSISRGMQAGQQIFRGGRGASLVERTMIVMTDGLHNRGPEPKVIAQELANEGVVIHTITFGSAADMPRMQEVARIGRGRYFHAEDGLQLQEIYRDIALSLSTLLTQ